MLVALNQMKQNYVTIKATRRVYKKKIVATQKKDNAVKTEKAVMENVVIPLVIAQLIVQTLQFHYLTDF
jgi:hypothetical protein